MPVTGVRERNGPSLLAAARAAFTDRERRFTESVSDGQHRAVSSFRSTENGAMSKQEVLWTTAGAAGVISAVTAGLTVWLFLTNPSAVTLAAGHAGAFALLHTVGGAVLEMAAHVLRYL
jgi:hypothetical protein